MELFSEPFREAILTLFDSNVALAATAHTARHLFTAELKRRPDVEVIRFTAANRNGLPAELADRLG